MHSKYTKISTPKGRLKLSQVLRYSGDFVRVADVAAALDVGHQEASQMLYRWTKQGWLKRISRGLYVPVSLESLSSEHVLADPWVLVPALYDPCYIGGRTAAEFWDLTEQIFRDIVVLTSSPIRSRSQRKHGTVFTLRKVREDRIFGTQTVWRSRTKVSVSDIHKTVIDMLEYPDLGGGIQHISDCLKAYFLHSDRDERKLLEYAKQNNNGAVFKRLGYLLERYSLDPMLADACRSNLSTGLAKLDPNLNCPRVVTKWRLKIPESWLRTDSD